jgi:hypothetical protein
MLSGIASLEWKWVKMQVNTSGYYSQASRKPQTYYSQASRKPQTLLAICAQLVEKKTLELVEKL